MVFRGDIILLKTKKEQLFNFDGDIRFALTISWNNDQTKSSSDIRITRKSGGGQGEGSIKTTIFNPRDTAVEVMTLEVVPWWLKPSLSARRVRNCEETAYIYKAGHDADRITGQIAFGLKINAGAACTVEYDFK